MYHMIDVAMMLWCCENAVCPTDIQMTLIFNLNGELKWPAGGDALSAYMIPIHSIWSW